MKLKVVANELVDADISMVSLVKHGANRCAFKVIKTAEDGPELSVGQKILKMFQKPEVPEPLAFFIRKGTEETFLPILREAGFADVCTEIDGVTILPVSKTYHPEDIEKGSLLVLDDDLGLAFSRPVIKSDADSAPMILGIRKSLEALVPALCAVLNTSTDDENALSEVVKTLDEFHSRGVEIAKRTPLPILKVEFGLSQETTEMRQRKLTEAMAGDLEGLTKSDPVIEAPVAETPPEPAQAALPTPVEKAESVSTGTKKVRENGKIIEKQYTFVTVDNEEIFVGWVAKADDCTHEDDKDKDDEKPAEGETAEAAAEEGEEEDKDKPAFLKADDKTLDNLVSAVNGLIKVVKSQGEAIQRLNTPTIAKTGAPIAVVHSNGNMDETFATPGLASVKRKLAKSGDYHAEKVWEGSALSSFDHF